MGKETTGKCRAKQNWNPGKFLSGSLFFYWKITLLENILAVRTSSQETFGKNRKNYSNKHVDGGDDGAGGVDALVAPSNSSSPINFRFLPPSQPFCFIILFNVWWNQLKMNHFALTHSLIRSLTLPNYYHYYHCSYSLHPPSHPSIHRTNMVELNWHYSTCSPAPTPTSIFTTNSFPRLHFHL